tara:strand:- start:34422 stop:34988 length:567 start_codon:yes stop_codon:yes gene_type:complete
MSKSNLKLLITEQEIQKKVTELAKVISEEIKLQHNPEPPIMVCVLKGGIMFFTELIKNMTVNLEIEFFEAQSYTKNRTAGNVKINKDTLKNVKGRVVYIVDDMVDSGSTMSEIITRLSDKGAGYIKTVTLVNRKDNTYDIDHICFPNMGKDWFVGFGFDDDTGTCRNYKNLYGAPPIEKTGENVEKTK